MSTSIYLSKFGAVEAITEREYARRKLELFHKMLDEMTVEQYAEATGFDIKKRGIVRAEREYHARTYQLACAEMAGSYTRYALTYGEDETLAFRDTDGVWQSNLDDINIEPILNSNI